MTNQLRDLLIEHRTLANLRRLSQEQGSLYSLLLKEIDRVEQEIAEEHKTTKEAPGGWTPDAILEQRQRRIVLRRRAGLIGQPCSGLYT